MDPNRNCIGNILNLPTHRLLKIYRKEFLIDTSYLYDEGKHDEIAIIDNRLEKMRQELSTRNHSPKYHNKHK
jgi:hypothetical protein